MAGNRRNTRCFPPFFSTKTGVQHGARGPGSVGISAGVLGSQRREEQGPRVRVPAPNRDATPCYTIPTLRERARRGV